MRGCDPLWLHAQHGGRHRRLPHNRQRLQRLRVLLKVKVEGVVGVACGLALVVGLGQPCQDGVHLAGAIRHQAPLFQHLRSWRRGGVATHELLGLQHLKPTEVQEAAGSGVMRRRLLWLRDGGHRAAHQALRLCLFEACARRADDPVVPRRQRAQRLCESVLAESIGARGCGCGRVPCRGGAVTFRTGTAGHLCQPGRDHA
mmetsp:Transcript_18997/g.49681  ORF Transcript_18997/g.49681 Transcript_18997/m.49681 type:complete len:201 (+) Transcript_18997:262-864(+)